MKYIFMFLFSATAQASLDIDYVGDKIIIYKDNQIIVIKTDPTKSIDEIVKQVLNETKNVLPK